MSKYLGRLGGIFVAVLCGIVLAACGGGGGGDGPAPTGVSYTSVAMAGELVTYSVDTTNLTYSYTITSSSFGLTGRSGSGTLTRNSNGTYSLSNIPNAYIAILPNGLLVGAIRDVFGGVTTTVPVLGIASPLTNLADAASTYNFLQWSCLGGTCASAFGTFQVNAGATWTSCPDANILAGACSISYSGTLTTLGNGMWQVLHGGVPIGTALAFRSSNGQNVVLLDLYDTRVPLGFGVGILVGSTQQALTVADTDGRWVAANNVGDWAVFRVGLGTNITYETVNGFPSSATSTVTLNSPWAGLGTTPDGVGALAGTGVYVFAAPGGYAELGIKIN